MSFLGTVDRFQQRHPGAGLPLAVLYKFIDDQGSYLAALITYYGFLSLFPLLLLLITILGYSLHNNPSLQQQLQDSVLSQIPVLGQQIGQDVHPLKGNVTALVIGILGSIYGGLGVAQAGQNAMNKVWGVPHAHRPNPFKARGRSLLLLLIVGGGVIVTTTLSGLTTSLHTTGGLGVALRIGSILLSIALNAVLFIVAFRLLTARDVGIRQVLEGAVLASVLWQVLQMIGTYYMGHKLSGASATYGTFGIVLGLLAWIFVGAMIVVFCAELNVVRAKRLWPRSLLTEFTDNVRLTAGDREAYTSYAETEQRKGFQTIDVDYDEKHTDVSQTSSD